MARICSHSYLFLWACLRFTEFRSVLAAATRPLRKKVVRTMQIHAHGFVNDMPQRFAEARINAKKLAEQSFDVATTQAILARLGLKPEPVPAANLSIVSSNIEKVKVSHAL